MMLDPRFLEDRAELVALASLPGMSARAMRELLTVFGSPRAAWESARSGHGPAVAGAARGGAWRDWARDVEPKAYLEHLCSRGIDALIMGEARYPSLLQEIHDPPRVLFVRGSPLYLAGPLIAVVGSRKATPYGLEAARWIAAGLARHGFTIVSGAAYGVDSAAHKGALEGGGQTVAVLGCGPDVAYPRSNSRLLDSVAERGCLVSEYPPGTPPLKHQFPARNRIIAGLTLGVVVVEAGGGSGALITSDFALTEGREVMAVPGGIFSPNSAGTNELVRNGAVPVTRPADVLEALGIVPEPREPPESPVPLSVVERDLLDAISSGGIDVEAAAGIAKVAPGRALALLSGMEVAGHIRRGPGGRYYPRAGA